MLLILVGMPFRLIHLSDLSFYADEETTALAARSLNKQGKAQMPSGMEYRRALPYTWLNAKIVDVLGSESEGAYRLGSALIGILAAPMLFFLGRTFVGMGPAFLAGLFLALSEWHLVFSRMARMYVPFTFFYVLAAWSIWRWATTARGRYLAAGIIAFIVTASLHFLGMFVVLFAVLPLLYEGTAAVSALALVGFAVLGAGGLLLYDQYFVAPPYGAFRNLDVTNRIQSGTSSIFITNYSPVILGLSLFVGICVALWILWKFNATSRERHSWTEQISLAFCFGTVVSSLFVGQIGAAIAATTVALLILQIPVITLLVHYRIWVVVGIIVSLVWASFMVVDLGLYQGIKSLFYFPYPYTLFLSWQFPIVSIFALVAVFRLILLGTSEESVRVLTLSILLPILVLGTVSKWGSTRYFFHLYPFILLIAGVGLHRLTNWLFRSVQCGPKKSLVLASMLIISGLLGQHGLLQAFTIMNISHGQSVDSSVHMFSFRPDHANPGQFVRAHAKDNDVIIAVDMLEQAWYIGRVDYWLRSFSDAKNFLYLDESGSRRDIYVSSQLLETQTEIDMLMTEVRDHALWVITSGEIDLASSSALNTVQREWLSELDRSDAEVFIGKDGRTKVYYVKDSTATK
ncbi:MAG: glycosyltransferase family 39 protein [Pirellulales bacterium]